MKKTGFTLTKCTKYVTCHCEGVSVNERPSQSQSRCNEITTSCLRTPRNDKRAFTLAEVLITLGVIGVVSAITMPVLIKNYQKHVYYTQFRKAATTLENALKLYAVENGCEGDIKNCFGNDDFFVNENNFVDNFSKYFNVAKLINDDNYEDVCKNYRIKNGFNTNELNYLDNGCMNDLSITPNNHAFITADGMLFNFKTDLGNGGGAIFDINGPNKEPNALGRDVFVFYLNKNSKSDITWGGNESEGFGIIDGDNSCTKDYGVGCAAKLLRDGKMDY